MQSSRAQREDDFIEILGVKNADLGEVGGQLGHHRRDMPRGDAAGTRREYEASGVGTDTVKTLDVVNHLLHRRAVVFLISDFQVSGDPVASRATLRRAVRQTNRRHDLIAVHIEDPREQELPNVGIIALEDAESGEIIELDTARAAVRKRFNEVSLERALRLRSDLRSEGVDIVQLRTDLPYIPPLQRFFKARGRPRV